MTPSEEPARSRSGESRKSVLAFRDHLRRAGSGAHSVRQGEKRQAPAAALKRAGITVADTYFNPIIDHNEARQKALAAHDKIKDAA